MLNTYPGHSLFDDQGGRNTALLQRSRGCRIAYRFGSAYAKPQQGVVIATNGTSCYIQPEEDATGPLRIPYAKLFDVAVTSRPIRDRLRNPTFLYPSFQELEERAQENVSLNVQTPTTVRPVRNSDGSITYM